MPNLWKEVQFLMAHQYRRLQMFAFAGRADTGAHAPHSLPARLVGS